MIFNLDRLLLRTIIKNYSLRERLDTESVLFYITHKRLTKISWDAL